MKRKLAWIAALAMFLSTAGCVEVSQAATSISAISESPAPLEEENSPSEEIARAVSYGLVPGEIQENYSASITFRQYSEMLTNLIRIWNPSRLGEWEQIISHAAQSDESMTREDGILATAYAMVLMGQNRPGAFFHTDIDRLMETMSLEAERPSWNYPLFPTWEEMGFPWCQSNYMWGGVYTCAILISRMSGLAIYPYDYEANSAHLHDPLTREEAICAVLRLGEIDPAVFEPEARYLSLSEVGTYDRTIITDALLNASIDLPEVTQAKLPSAWRGAGLSNSKNEGVGTGCTDFRETDIKFLADNGFNFARVFFSFSTLRFPDYPADGRLVNENELRDLDQLVAWGMKYGVHIQLSMCFFQDEGGNSKADGSIAANDAQWAITNDYWTMLARRYAGIPSKYLTFDLCNEIEPSPDGISYAKSKLGGVVSSIREADGARVLLYSFQGNPNQDWINATASLGLAIGCHPYYPQYISTTGYEYAEHNPYAYPAWPQPWFPMGNVQEGSVPLVIQGNLSDAELSIHVNEGVEGAAFSILANGQVVKQFQLTGGILGENGGQYFYDRLYTAALPAGTKEIEIQVAKSNGYVQMDTILVRGSMGEIVMVPHDTMDYPDRSDPLPLVIKDDGTYTNSENRMVDGEEIYRVDVKPYQDIAARYGVGFMVNEFGIFGNNIDWDSEIVTAYHQSVLQMLTDHGIGWSYCELYNPISKHLVLMPASGTTEFQWDGATEQKIQITCESGNSWEYTAYKELLEVFRKFTMQ